MTLSVGIVGLPNVGKSTLFNALSAQQAEAANYAFCTIDPNVGIVTVPDPRFDALCERVRPHKRIAATVAFTDIAGLVKGASKGEGRGNAFLSHIRDCDAIAHVGRCFDDAGVLHVDGRVDPVADVETIHTELMLRDLDTVRRRLERARKLSKGQDPVERQACAVCEQLASALDRGLRAALVPVKEGGEARIVRELCLLTAKPLFYIANVSEKQLAHQARDPLLARLRQVAGREGAPLNVICAAVEAEIMQLPPAERPEFLASLGLEEPSLDEVIRTGYRMLDLITFFTAGPKEVRAWTIKAGSKAPQAAGRIHSDFERGFIRAEVIAWRDLVELGSEAACRSAGKLGVEGKDYRVRDGDVIHFRFNV